MTHSRLSFVALAALCLVGPSMAQVKTADVTGAWLLELNPDFGGHQDTIGCTFKQDRQNVTGECGHDSDPKAPLVGHVKDDMLTFEFKTGRRNEQTATFIAKLEGQASTMKGGWRFVDEQGKDHQGKFSGRRLQ